MESTTKFSSHFIKKYRTTRLEMTPQSGSVDGRKGQTGAYKDKSKPVDIRSSNINAAKGRSIVICTCLSCIVVVLIQYVELSAGFSRMSMGWGRY